MSKANETQVGGDHYKMPGAEEHWDRAWRLQWDPFQYQITKYVERWKKKNGVQDLKKARHFLDKYIELVEAADAPLSRMDEQLDPVDTVDAAVTRAINPTAWNEFTYEGGSAGVDYFRCRKCREHFSVVQGMPPTSHKCPPPHASEG